MGYLLTNEWELAWALGATLSVIFILSILFNWILSSVWKWVDDGESVLDNKVVAFCKKVFGSEDWYEIDARRPDGSLYGTYYFKKKHTEQEAYRAVLDGSHGVDYRHNGLNGVDMRWLFYPAIILCLLPVTLLIAFKLYALTLFISTFVALALLARFTRRFFKKFKKHAQDPFAHEGKSLSK